MLGAQSRDCIKELAAIPTSDADILRGKVGKNRLVNLVLAECCLVLPEAQAPQPDHNIHRACAGIHGGIHSPGQVWFQRVARSNQINSDVSGYFLAASANPRKNKRAPTTTK